MSEQDLTPSLQQQMLAEMVQLRAELSRLQAQVQALSGSKPSQATKPALATSRRTALRRLATTILGTVGIAGTATVGGGVPTAQAQLIANPPTNGLSGKAGALVLPPGAAQVTNTAPGYAYGLIACGDTTPLDTSLLVPFNTGLSGFGSGNSLTGVGVNGKGQYGVSGTGTDTGVSGYAPNFGVSGFGPNGTGVYGEGGSIGVSGYTTAGYGVIASSGSGTPFRIVPGNRPASATPQYGDMYVNTIGSLFIYQLVPGQGGPSWRQVNTTNVG